MKHTSKPSDTARHALIETGLKAGLVFGRARLFADYALARGWDNDSPYLHEWAARFLRHEEWRRSDYAGRQVLQSLSNVYPNDLDAFEEM